MKPYKTIRLTAGPDCGENAQEGRKSSAAGITGKGGDIRASQKPRNKAASRRILKRRDRAESLRQSLLDLKEAE